MPLPQCFPPSRPSPCGLVRLPVSKHLQRSILPAANPDCRQSRLAAPLRVVRTVSGKPATDLPSQSRRLPPTPSILCKRPVRCSLTCRQIIRSDCSFDCIDALFFGHSCLRYHHTFILLYALKKNKKSAKVVRLMVSVKVRRLTPSASRNLDGHQRRTEKAVLFLFLFFPVFLFLFSENSSSVYSVEARHIVTGSIGLLSSPILFLLLHNVLSFCYLFA